MDESTTSNNRLRRLQIYERRVQSDRRPLPQRRTQALWNGGPKDHEKGQKLSVNDNTVRLLFATLIKSDYPDLAKEFRIR